MLRLAKESALSIQYAGAMQKVFDRNKNKSGQIFKIRPLVTVGVSDIE